jgi:hypothetical protein
MSEKLDRMANRAASTLGGLGAIGTLVSSTLVFDPDTRQLVQVKIGGLPVWDRERATARRARRAERRQKRRARRAKERADRAAAKARP